MTDEMISQYEDYLYQHISNVKKGYNWLISNLYEEVVPADIAEEIYYQLDAHDNSKYSKEEFEPYCDYFYGPKSPEVRLKFEYAWLRHIHNNPHHWQYWLLQHDDGGEPEALEMPKQYIIEMICDWWAFSWKANNLREIFSWYDEHKSTIKLHENSRKNVEYILNKMKEVLDKKGN